MSGPGRLPDLPQVLFVIMLTLSGVAVAILICALLGVFG